MPPKAEGISGCPTYLGNQHLVAGGHAHGQALAILVEGAGADGQDLGLVELLDARLGQEDAAGGLGLGLDALHDHAVEQGDEGLDGAERGGLSRGIVSMSVYRPSGHRIRCVELVCSSPCPGEAVESPPLDRCITTERQHKEGGQLTIVVEWALTAKQQVG